MNLLDSIGWPMVNIDDVVANSYKDYHAKGLDYLCLHRSPSLTVKAYFFESGVQALPEVVNPHDHRYSFWTTCMSGTIRNRWYRVPPCWDGETVENECGRLYNVFAWHTPLLGGKGFSPAGDVPLQQYRYADFQRGRGYFMDYEEIHTIQVMEPETCIVIAQFADKLTPSQSTHLFTQDSEPPSLDGLYNKLTADEAVKRINLLQELVQ